jgi:hypothetical protein
MKLPTPDPAGQDADEIRPEFEAALDAGQSAKAVNLAVRAMYMTALNLSRASNIPAPRPLPARLKEICMAFRDACDLHITAHGDDFKVQTARHAFDTIVAVETVLQEGGDHLPPVELVGRLLLLGASLGHSDVMLSLVTSGIWADYDDALSTVHAVGSPRRKIRPPWETEFVEEAQRFAAAMGEGVTQAAIARRAKSWAKERAAQGRPVEDLPDLPGIITGIRRMRKRREIIVPSLGDN